MATPPKIVLGPVLAMELPWSPDVQREMASISLSLHPLPAGATLVLLSKLLQLKSPV